MTFSAKTDAKILIFTQTDKFLNLFSNVQKITSAILLVSIRINTRCSSCRIIAHLHFCFPILPRALLSLWHPHASVSICVVEVQRVPHALPFPCMAFLILPETSGLQPLHVHHHVAILGMKQLHLLAAASYEYEHVTVPVAAPRESEAEIHCPVN